MQTLGGRFLPLLAVGLAATAALKLMTLGLARLDCWLLAPLVAAAAWPLWAWRREQLMFVRRLLLAGAATESGWVRRRFWRGTLVQSLGVVTALLWAGLMLLMAAQLTGLQWGILAADAALLAALSPALRQLLRRQIAPPFIGTVARRWPLLWGNTLLLLAAFVVHDYWVGFADTRALSWSALVAQTLQSGHAQAACPTAGTLLGMAALADRLPRHAAMLLLPGVADAQARLLAWLMLLAFTGFGSWLFTRCLLGAQALLEGWRAPDAAHDEHPRPGRLFVAASLAVGALAGLWAALGPRADVAMLEQAALRLAQAANPCGTAAHQAQALQAGARQQLDRASRQALDGAMRGVDNGLDAAFAAAEAGIDAYLDWYFSFIGSYTRLGALVIPGLAQHMRQQFATQVLADSGFEHSLARLASEADARLLDAIAAEAAALGRGFTQQLQLQPCLREALRPAALPGLERDGMRMALSAAIALPLSRAVLPLALHAGQAVMARAAARQTVKAAAQAAGATASKSGSSVLLSAGAGAAVCAPGGPLALACAAAAAVVTWIAVDMAMLAIDEALFRKSLRAELVEELQREREQLREGLRLQLEQAAADYAAQAGQRIDAVFVPATDG
ncbi:MAG TPA: hypothetical protein PKB14_18660 [Rubrivivax sp.]|nr:hypothetical protein [Rubrivivax sp.]